LEVSDKLHTPASLFPVKWYRDLLDRRLGGPRTGVDDIERRTILLYWNSNSNFSAFKIISLLKKIELVISYCVLLVRYFSLTMFCG
jgi:hypothetical protein